MSVKINKAPVYVDFSALDDNPDNEWKKALVGGEGNEVYLSELLGAGVGEISNDTTSAAEPLTELPEEPVAGQHKEDESVIDLVGKAFNWASAFASSDSAPTSEELAAKKTESKKLPPKKKAVKITNKKAVTIKKTPVRKVPAKKKTFIPITKEAKARESLISKYRSYSSRFNLNAESHTKTTKQLAKYSLPDLEREYQLLKAKSNEGEVEEICYDIFEAALNMFAKVYARKLKYSMINTVYGSVDLIYIQEIIDEKFDEETGDPHLKRALAEAAIECAEWLCQPWYTRLAYHAHKIILEAGALEMNRRIGTLSGNSVSDAGREVLSKLHLKV